MGMAGRSKQVAEPWNGPLEATTLEGLLEAARTVAQDVVEDEAVQCDRTDAWPEKSFEAVQRNGLAGLVVPREHGGLHQGLVGLGRVCETFGYHSAAFGIAYGMHCVGTAVLAANATPDQAIRYLRPIAEGKHITTLALSEPGSGSHFYYPSSTLRREGRSYQVDGEKSFVTNGGYADSYVVSTAAEGDAGMFSCVMVDGASPGLSFGDILPTLGMRGNASRVMRLKGVLVDPEDVLGELGDQIWYVFHVVAPFFLTAMSGTYLGVAQRALDEARSHLKRRTFQHDASKLAEHEVLQHRLGTMWARVQRTRRLVYWACEEGDSGGPDALAALCSAKAEVADCAVQVANDALTLLGGRGYDRNHVATRLLRDARAAPVMSPTTDLLRTWTGRSLLDIPILGA